MTVLVKTTRGKFDDTEHHGIVTVCDVDGNVLYAVGDHNRLVFSRSSAKPFQAISVVESGALEEYGISEKELAVMCSSHNAESFHVDAIRSILKKADLDESYLKCGSHMPIAQYVANEFIKNDIKPTEVHSNCSGKHSGMLITAKKLGYSMDDYYDLEHPIQQIILDNLAFCCVADKDDIEIGIDGCGVPVHALPMHKWARGFAILSKPEVMGEDRAKTVRRITTAMTNHPEMIAGDKRICTALNDVFGDRLFAKSGALAFYGIGIKDRGIGISIKLLDAKSEMLPFVIFEVLIELGVITRDELSKLDEFFTDINMYNFRHEVVGEKFVAFDMKDYKYYGGDNVR